jgi:hypothetical protein
LTVRDIEKYRRRHPAQQLPGLEHARCCAVIPCYNENAALETTLLSLKEAASEVTEEIAFLAVVNYPSGADATESLELYRRIREGDLHIPDLFVIYAPELKGGVGEARKIGMDSFLQTLPAEKVPEALIFSMDADTLVDRSYFREVIRFFKENKQGGVSIGLRHYEADTPEQETAIRRYEAYLDRYAEKLKQAGSPYAFHTVGSAFAVTGEAYIKCGGMEVRQAGEDFYFLQEVAKTSGVGVIEQKLVFPSPRISNRTHFGTGQSVKDLLSGKPLSEVSDSAFDRLQRLLATISVSALDTDTPLLPDKAFFEAERFFKVWPGIRRNTPATKLCQAFHIWFDGLKTLRYLHWADA